MTSLGIYHWTGNNRSGVEASIASFRVYHPDAPYFLVCDGGPDHYDICKRLKVEYYHSQINLGYPSPHWGHNRHRVKIFLERILMACVALGTSHLVISEDDVICLNPIQYDPTWQVASYDIQGGNFITQEVLDTCEKISGVKPDRTCYGVGAGTIINCQTFIDNFSRMKEFLEVDFDRLHQNQPQLGWNDCFLQVYFFLAGVSYSVNPRLHNIFPEDPNTDLDALQKSYDMVHNYKNFYENRK